MNEVRLSTRAQQLLAAAGWHPQRQVDLAPIQAALAADGYALHSAAEAFLSEFAGLHISFPHPLAGALLDDFDFDAAAAAADVEPERVLIEYVERVKEPLCIVGSCHSGHMVLAMAPSRKVYGGYDEVLVLVGESGEEAIEALLAGDKLPAVP